MRQNQSYAKRLARSFMGVVDGAENIIAGRVVIGSCFFGDLRFSGIFAKLSDELKKDLEDIYGCEVIEKGSYTIVRPKVVEEYLKRKGFLASYDRELQEDLFSWFKQNFKDVVLDVLHSRQ